MSESMGGIISECPGDFIGIGSEGHRRGVDALRRTVRVVGELGIQILTLFSFSAENW
jgi:hypothetical protein